jgi:hydroxymethylbilane synthase
MDGLVGAVNGDRLVNGHIEGESENAEILGIRLAEDILTRGAREILNEVYSRNIPPVNGDISS